MPTDVSGATHQLAPRGVPVARTSARVLHIDAESIVRLLVFAVVFFFIAAPVGYLFYGSLRTDSPGSATAVFTLDNWIAVYTTPQYRIALINTLALAAAVSILSVALGAALAWILARTDTPGRNFLAPLLVVPLMISTLVTSLAWIALCAPNAGFVNALAREYLGVRVLFDIYSFAGITLVLVLHYASFAFVPIYAALRSLNGSLEEASYMLGAGPMRTAVKMTLPLIRPALVSTFIIIFIFVAENFSVPAILGTSTRFYTLASLIYVDMSSEPSKPTMAAAAGTTLIWLALIGTLWQRGILRNAGRYVTIAGKDSRSLTAGLGPWRYVTAAFVWLYLALAVIIPYFTLIFASFMKFVTPRITWALFTTDNYTRVFNWNNLAPTQNSLILAAGGGLIAALLYVFLAYLIKRSNGWMSRTMDQLVNLPTVIPALVLGVGFIWAFVASPLYGTIWILFIAYLTRYVGLGVRQSRAAFVQVSDELSEAARICGAPPLRTFRDISLPLLRPAVSSLWTLLFIMIFMEISLTIILYTPETFTLSVLLWARMSSGYQTQAFAIAVAQATIVFAVLFVAERMFGILRASLQR
jgi:iron(III) transport system permease protein